MFKRAALSTVFLSLFCLSPIALAETAPSAQVTAIEAQMESDDYKGAIKAIIAAQKSGQDDYEMRNRLVEAYGGHMDQVGMLKKMGMAKKMKTAMEAALELGPNEPDAIENLMMFHIQAPSAVGGDKDQVPVLLARLETIDPLRAHFGQAMLARGDEDYITAEASLEKALDIDPLHEDSLLALGVVKFSQKDYAGAITAFERCTAVLPEAIDCEYQIGKMAQVGEIQTEKGIAAFGRYFAGADDNVGRVAYGHFRLGKLHEQAGNTDAAKAQYQMAIDKDNLKEAKAALKALR